MKIILLKDVGGVGQRDSVKDVSDGHALNFLIPQGFAVQATPEKIAALEAKKKSTIALSAEQEQTFAESATRLEGARIEVFVKANERQHLYKQLTGAQVAEAIRKQFSIALEPGDISFEGHIKTLGEFPVIVKMGKSRAQCTVGIKALEERSK